MTDELFAKIVIQNEMYVVWKTTPVTDVNFERSILQFKGYEKLVLKEIETAKREYFGRVFAAYRSDMKKTWKIISETLSVINLSTYSRKVCYLQFTILL